MSVNLYDLEAIAPNLANWADRLQANVDILNALDTKRALVTLGEGADAFDCTYIKASDGRAYKAKGVAGMLPAIGLINEAGITSDEVRIVTFGIVTNPAWTWTPQKVLVVSAATAGQLVEAPALLPIGADQLFQVVAVSLTATSIFFCPSIGVRMDFKAGAYTASGKPATGDFLGQQIFVTDAGTTGRLAYWAADNVWRYVKDDTAV